MADFSCYVTIQNRSSKTLTNGTWDASWGGYDTTPPTAIQPNETVSFHLKDHAGPNGSTGWVKYLVDGGTIQFNYDDPYAGSNKATIEKNNAPLYVCLYAKSGENHSWDGNVAHYPREFDIPTDGHPFSVLFVLFD